MDITDIKKLQSLVVGSAPLLGAVLGGNYVSVALSLLAKLFGTSESIPELIAKISSTREVAEQLKQVENQHCEVLQKLANDSFAQEVEDRKSARQRQVDAHDFVPTLLAVGFFIVWPPLHIWLALHASPMNDRMSTVLQTIAIMIGGYFFGKTHPNRDNHD